MSDRADIEWRTAWVDWAMRAGIRLATEGDGVRLMDFLKTIAFTAAFGGGLNDPTEMMRVTRERYGE